MASCPTQLFDYIFGYGSIINTETHAQWILQHEFPGRRALVRGYCRSWNFRSSTGFTALGVTRGPSNSSAINGVLYRIPHSALAAFDKREVGYTRTKVPLDFLDLDDSPDGDTAGGQQQQQQQQPSLDDPTNLLQVLPHENVWIYVPIKPQSADEDHPILQSYVDTVMQGCLAWGGTDMTKEFIATTDGWSTFFLNDTPSSRRPWLFRREYDTIDSILREYAEKTFYAERRHPEEFASAFLIRMMRGTWSVPKRNALFTGRETEIAQIHSRLATQNRGEDIRTAVSILEVVGMGGVGKSQICTEYCYRYFSTYYGLIIWLNAQSAESISTGYRQLVADTTGTDVKEMDTEEVITEVKARLFRSSIPWLLVLDNLDDRTLLEKFVPHGASCGHVLVTTRQVGEGPYYEEQGQASALMLGCFTPQESVELLRRSSGTRNKVDTELTASRQLADQLGHLPLALGVAAAYMRQCDVSCAEYLSRYMASSGRASSTLGVQAVEASVALSLEAISKENPIALDAVRLLCWLAPDEITKPLVRSLFQTRKEIRIQSGHARSERAIEVRTKRMVYVARTALVGSVLAFAFLSRPRSKVSAYGVAAVATGLFFSTPTFFSAVTSGMNSAKDVEPPGRIRSRPSFSSDEFELTDQIWTILKSFSILNVREGKGSMHRLLGQTLRTSFQDGATKLENLRICIHTVINMWTFSPENVETWQKSSDLLEHLKAVVAFASYENSVGMQVETNFLAREAGVFAAMALNRFQEAQHSLEKSLAVLSEESCPSKIIEGARACSLQELGRVYRYQGNFEDSERSLQQSLKIRIGLARYDDVTRKELGSSQGALSIGTWTASVDRSARRDVAATLHEIGVLESKKHNLKEAARYLELSLRLRRSLYDFSVKNEDIEAECAATLHQLAAVHVAKKPTSLDVAEALLEEALGLRMQIGARAATLKQLARVAIRRGEYEKADRALSQALELYVELYGETMHINVAAVKFQQGALAHQRDDLEQAWIHFSEALEARKHVYAYSNGQHLEVAVVLHQLGCVAFEQGRVLKAEEMLTTEKQILSELYLTSSQRDRIGQARLTNLSWLRKCAKALGNEDNARSLTAERSQLKHTLRTIAREVRTTDETTIRLQRESLLCRLEARRFALALRNDSLAEEQELVQSLTQLERVESESPNNEFRQSVQRFRHAVASSLHGDRNPQDILRVCDELRNILREHGIEVHDSTRARRS